MSKIAVSDIKSKPHQLDRIIQYLKSHKTITSGEAFYQLGISYLPVVIRDLKRSGKRVFAKMECGKNRYGDKCTFKRYALKKINDLYKAV